MVTPGPMSAEIGFDLPRRMSALWPGRDLEEADDYKEIRADDRHRRHSSDVTPSPLRPHAAIGAFEARR